VLNKVFEKYDSENQIRKYKEGSGIEEWVCKVRRGDKTVPSTG